MISSAVWLTQRGKCCAQSIAVVSTKSIEATTTTTITSAATTAPMLHPGGRARGGRPRTKIQCARLVGIRCKSASSAAAPKPDPTLRGAAPLLVVILLPGRKCRATIVKTLPPGKNRFRAGRTPEASGKSGPRARRTWPQRRPPNAPSHYRRRRSRQSRSRGRSLALAAERKDFPAAAPKPARH